MKAAPTFSVVRSNQPGKGENHPDARGQKRYPEGRGTDGSASGGSKELRVLGVAELAKIFHCSTESIKRKARSGELPAFKFGKFWYVREADLEQYLATTVHSNGHLRRDQEIQT